MNSMKRISIFSAILTLLIGADGIYMQVVHYKADDVNKFNLSDGGTILVAAAILLIITVISFLLSRSKDNARG